MLTKLPIPSHFCVGLVGAFFMIVKLWYRREPSFPALLDTASNAPLLWMAAYNVAARWLRCGHSLEFIARWSNSGRIKGQSGHGNIYTSIFHFLNLVYVNCKHKENVNRQFTIYFFIDILWIFLIFHHEEDDDPAILHPLFSVQPYRGIPAHRAAPETACFMTIGKLKCQSRFAIFPVLLFFS